MKEKVLVLLTTTVTCKNKEDGLSKKDILLSIMVLVAALILIDLIHYFFCKRNGAHKRENHVSQKKHKTEKLSKAGHPQNTETNLKCETDESAISSVM